MSDSDQDDYDSEDDVYRPHYLPDGTQGCSFSRIDPKDLALDFPRTTSSPAYLTCLRQNYNVLRLMSGLGSCAFSNEKLENERLERERLAKERARQEAAATKINAAVRGWFFRKTVLWNLHTEVGRANQQMRIERDLRAS